MTCDDGERESNFSLRGFEIICRMSDAWVGWEGAGGGECIMLCISIGSVRTSYRQYSFSGDIRVVCT